LYLVTIDDCNDTNGDVTLMRREDLRTWAARWC
jgi:hypothetical protein